MQIKQDKMRVKRKLLKTIFQYFHSWSKLFYIKFAFTSKKSYIYYAPECLKKPIEKTSNQMPKGKLALEKRPTFQDLLNRCSLDIVAIQKKLDHRFYGELKNFQQDIFNLPKEHREFLMAAFPPHQRIKKHKIKTRMSWEKDRNIKAGLNIKLLNLSADIRLQRSQASDSFLHIELEQVPTKKIKNDEV